MGTLKIRGIGPIAIMSRIIYNIRDMKGGGIVDNGYTKRIRERVLSLEDGTVFVMSDFAEYCRYIHYSSKFKSFSAIRNIAPYFEKEFMKNQNIANF